MKGFGDVAQDEALDFLEIFAGQTPSKKKDSRLALTKLTKPGATGHAMLHSGCEYYDLRSACIDVSQWQLVSIFALYTKDSTQFQSKVEYHSRMDLMRGIGFLTALQFAGNLGIILDCVLHS